MRTSPAGTVVSLAICVTLAVSLGSSRTVAFAAPSTSAIEAKREQANAANKRVEELATDLELKGEELAEIEEAVSQTRAQITATELELALADADVSRSQSLLNRRVSSIYRSGKTDIVSVFVGATDFGDFITRVDLLRRVSRADASVVATVKDAKQRVETSRQALESRQAEQIALRSRTRAKQDEVKTAYSQQRTYLAGLTSELKKLVAQERERQEKLAAEAAAEAAAKATEVGKVNGSRSGARTFVPGALGAPHPSAVTIARKYLGVPYEWGGTDPSGFDCSGLTSYAYRQIGVSIPRTSRSQYRIGAYIPPDRLDLLAAGDLVFFGYGGDPSRIHHVGMYVGGGAFIHAPSTGDVVSITSLTGRIASRGDYVGACRP